MIMMSFYKKYSSQVAAVSGLNIGQLSIGLALGFSSSLLPQLKQDDEGLEISDKDLSWIVSILSLGQIFGGISGSILSDMMGRKGSTLLSSLPSILGWLLIAFSQQDLMLYAGRLASGIGIGMAGAVYPVYVCEMSSPEIRGVLVGSGVVVITVGIFAAFVLGTFLKWRTVALLSAVPPLIMVCAIIFIPETPVWLEQKGKLGMRDKSMIWLKRDINLGQVPKSSNSGQNGQTRDNDIQEVKCAIGRFFRREVMFPLFISITLFVVQNFSGFPIVISYAVSIFKSAGVLVDEFYATIMLGLVQVVGCSVASVIINRVGRRVLLMWSSVSSSITLAILGLCYYLKESDLITNPLAKDIVSVLPLISLLAFMVTFTLGLGPVPWTLVGELFPSDVRSLSAGISSSFCYGSIFLANLAFLPLANEIMMYGVFWLCSGVALIGFAVTYLLLPETRDRPLNEIEEFFKKPQDRVEGNKLHPSNSNSTLQTNVSTVTISECHL